MNIYIKSRKSSSILMKIRKICYFRNRFQYPYHLRYQSKIISVIQIQKKITLFVNSCNIFSVIYLIEHSNTYINCYVIITYMQKKNLLLLPWILRLILDTLDDTTPLCIQEIAMIRWMIKT